MNGNDLKQKTKNRKPALRSGRDPEQKTAPRRVFIDLDDAYGIPFSSAPVSPQGYGTDREKSTD